MSARTREKSPPLLIYVLTVVHVCWLIAVAFLLLRQTKKKATPESPKYLKNEQMSKEQLMQVVQTKQRPCFLEKQTKTSGVPPDNAARNTERDAPPSCIPSSAPLVYVRPIHPSLSMMGPMQHHFRLNASPVFLR